jgi:hypothetical protein
MRHLAGLLILFCMGCGGGDDSSFSLLPDSQTFIAQKTFNNKLDILFVINSEPSMSSFQQRLVTSFSSFMSLFQNKGFDFKIAVVTASAYMADTTLAGYNPANIDFADFNDYDGSVHSGVFVINPATANLLSVFAINAKPTKNPAGQDGRAFSSFRQALQSTRPLNTGFLRPDSFLSVVIVDNQDDFSDNTRCAGCHMNWQYTNPTLDAVSAYKTFLETVTGTSGATARFNVSAMTQTGVACQGSQSMTRIPQLVNMTNGVLGNICDMDFGPALGGMSDQIGTLSSQFFLDREPLVSSIVVAINGVLINQDAANGWTYDAAANSIQFHGSAIPAQGSLIAVDFDPVSLE